MVNAWIDSYRRAEKRPREALTDSFTNALLSTAERRYNTAPSAEDRNLREMPSEALESALQTLSVAQQTAVFYADICELPYKVIAEITGLPIGTVMSHIHRGRYRLRAYFAQSAQKRSA
jgi:RNA polymerase sigma-70 factor (ECF subfamily)